MKNALLNAAIHMTMPFGYRVCAWKLDQKLEIPQEKLADALKVYVDPAIEFYDIAEGVRMGDCAEPVQPFVEFGKWFATHLREHGKYPEQKEALAALSVFIFQAFTGGLTREQDTILQSRLAAEVAEYDDE